MILRYHHLSRFPAVFQSRTGLRLNEFTDVLADVLPRYAEAEVARLHRPTRMRAPGGGRQADLAPRDQILLSIVWLRQYPTNEVVGYLFGVSDSTVSRLMDRVVPVLQAVGRDTMRLPDPGRKRRRSLDALLAETPELAVVIATVEQRVQRPRDRSSADGDYSGKKQQHTLKSQVAVHEETGEICDVADSVPGPTADITRLKQSGLLARLPEGSGGIGDLA